MKYFFKLALAAALIISMTACGSETQIENNENSVLEFDRNWAKKIGLLNEMPIPEPPFPVECPRVIGAFETTEPLPENAIEEIKEYCNLLEKIGYNIGIISEFIESDTGGSPEYRFEAMNSEYVHVYVSYYDNSMIIICSELRIPQNEKELFS